MPSPVQSASVIIFSLLLGASALAQIQIGTVRGRVSDPAGALLPGAAIKLLNPLTGHSQAATTDERGQFTLNNVPFAPYTLRIEAAGFQPSIHQLSVRSNIPVIIEAKLLVAGASESTTIEAKQGLVEADVTSTQTEIDENFIQRAPSALGAHSLQALIATTPGWMTENNGLLHIRGVDDGILYVVDGIPTSDRLDAVSASPFDTDLIRSLKVITGNFPAEFGGRSGAVVIIQPKSGIDLPLHGSLAASAANFRAGDIAYSLGGSSQKKYGFFLSSSANRSDRFLDPVDARNFNNRGGAVKLSFRFDWHPTARDVFLFDASANGADFHVPNDDEQEMAGQRQRQELRDNDQALSWQRVWSSATVSNFAYFRRSYRARLFGSRFDTPIFAAQDRQHTRQGVIASLTHVFRGHILKSGLEVTRVAPREFFSFAVTDREAAEAHDISEAALAFDLDHPFVFRGRRSGSQWSWYLQDHFSPVRHLTINAGLRYDRSSLPVTDQQFSPRLGVVYFIPATRTAIRASFNRLYMPPQVENLLLADSEQARQLSPFATTEVRGGATIRPEKVSAFEAGLMQDVAGILRLDAAYWWRFFRNFDDPNVFFNTTIIFPNSVVRGFARGVDVRLEVPEHRGWSGYVSYTNARILQTGPINGGLFLTDEFIEIGPGTRFIPDHDQRNVGAFGAAYHHRRSGWWASLSGRHESGAPLEVEDERLAELRSAPGAELVNFERKRVRPRTVFDFAIGIELRQSERVSVEVQFNVQNIGQTPFAYNFGNPFEGTHFGHPRLWGGHIKFTFHSLNPSTSTR